MIHKKLLSLLVLLIAVTSAWAQDHEYVDLGLPSGTLWATCNVGADSPEQNGSFFALGEVEPKTTYTRNNYKWGTNPAETSTLTKYCDSDGLNTLLPEDDAATVNWGVQWCMPTRAQVDELIENCNVTTTTLNGKAGYLYTSKINSETIFFPNAGYVDDANGTYYGNNERAYYWTSTAYEEYEPGKKGGWMHYNWNGVEGIKTKPACRGCGMPVRPVFNKDAVPVTTNKAQGETTFTQATFAMPAFDATVDYDIVRDMAVQMTTKVGDAADDADYRIRLKKKDSKWELADMTISQLMALISVHDAIEDKDLTYYSETGPVDCTVKIYAIDDNDQLAAQPTDYADLEPGRYVAIAVAEDGSNYIGETAQSNVIVLYQGYKVTVPAKEFITYYKDEPLREEEEDIELYTISSVSDGKATLMGPMDAMKKNKPMLIYNKSDEAKTFYLIPCQQPDLLLFVAPEFKGTLEATTIPASTATQTNYALNGKQFVYVKTAIPVAANKAWLEVSNSNARSIELVFDGEATGINEAYGANGNYKTNEWYDLNGRKLNAAPNRKGVFIQNGKKVVK